MMSRKQITKELRTEKRIKEKEMKILLLGAGNTGKSTVAKQMRIIHSNGFSFHDRKNYRWIVYENIFSNINLLINAAKYLSLKLADFNLEPAARLQQEAQVLFRGDMLLTPQNMQDLRSVWEDPNIQRAFLRGHEFHLQDSTSYQLERIGKTDYLPTQQDILRVRAKTMGIVDINFTVDSIKFKMVDTGGERSERRKWIYCFEDVTAVIFFAPLSEYIMRVIEDGVTNRMHESLKLFDEVCNSEFFVDTSMILFLNKEDIFRDKIERFNLSICFDDYTGPNDYTKGIKFISAKFLAVNQNSKKNIYIHVTCAVDTECVAAVFNAVKDIILRAALYGAGIL